MRMRGIQRAGTIEENKIKERDNIRKERSWRGDTNQRDKR
jgi:hypothetical protein